MPGKQDVLRAFAELSVEDQVAVRTELAERASAGCCGTDEMQQHMAAMMKMMQSAEKPMECCQQMMSMCREMMERKGATASAAPRAEHSDEPGAR